MLRSAASKVMWVGRATVFLVGLAVILALVLGLASVALGTTGQNFILGKANNTAETPTGLVSTLADAAKSALIVTNKSGGSALDLRVGNATTPANTVAPMRVNSQKVVTRLNADKLDGKNASELQEPRGYAHITDEGTVDTVYPSKGIAANGVLIPTGETSVYCFDLTFDDPKAAMGSPFITNSAVVATVTPPNALLDSNCDGPHNDAAAQTFGSDTGTGVPINFQIVFF
jgi:hypothetical protein